MKSRYVKIDSVPAFLKKGWVKAKNISNPCMDKRMTDCLYMTLEEESDKKKPEVLDVIQVEPKKEATPKIQVEPKKEVKI